MDFSDDAHLAAALAKNKKNLLGKKVSIARSDPQQSKKKGTFGPKSTSKHGMILFSCSNSSALSLCFDTCESIPVYFIVGLYSYACF